MFNFHFFSMHIKRYRKIIKNVSLILSDGEQNVFKHLKSKEKKDSIEQIFFTTSVTNIS